ncbi:MAG: response regulator, partial [Deltaproteobacteria bacterium]|nr:response regulator [Deltaproteobacteria bacterium]
MIKILLIDDEVDFVKTLSKRLERRNFPSNVALDGEQALQLVTNEVPDVVVLDLKMPGLSGQEVLRYLKKSNPDIQVIILTGHGSEQARLETLLLGAYKYLEKPVNIDTLIQSILEAYRAR